jgi:hypothetical protein
MLSKVLKDKPAPKKPIVKKARKKVKKWTYK